uniref:Transcription elongation factor 1 homolog n=1 Tax=Steinernema glaseri TaxID=37863 RepID=A0A1I7ZZH3_9BILA
MARRKPLKKVAQKKEMEKLATLFNCPFCQREHVCSVKMDRKMDIGHIKCDICLEDFQTKIHHLSEPIDVYNDWIDACEEANM